jgi:hypothetical protein
MAKANNNVTAVNDFADMHCLAKADNNMLYTMNDFPGVACTDVARYFFPALLHTYLCQPHDDVSGFTSCLLDEDDINSYVSHHFVVSIDCLATHLLATNSLNSACMDSTDLDDLTTSKSFLPLDLASCKDSRFVAAHNKVVDFLQYNLFNKSPG